MFICMLTGRTGLNGDRLDQAVISKKYIPDSVEMIWVNKYCIFTAYIQAGYRVNPAWTCAIRCRFAYSCCYYYYYVLTMIANDCVSCICVDIGWAIREIT